MAPGKSTKYSLACSLADGVWICGKSTSLSENFSNTLKALRAVFSEISPTIEIFTTLDESIGIYLFCEGGNVEIKELVAWEMMPSNPY